LIKRTKSTYFKR